MPSIVDNIYPPVLVTPWWMIASIASLVGIVVGYYLVRWIRVRLALKRQQKLLAINKPHKAEIINRALQELARIRQEVTAGTLPAHQGAQQVSLTVRAAFDAVMNHQTQYSAKYEVAARSLRVMTELLTEAYPAEFAGRRPDAAAFERVYNQAVKVVQSCN